MGILVDLNRYRADRQLRQAMDRLQDQAQQTPAPSVFGWLAAERAEDGVPIRWFHPRYRAFIGYVPGRPDLVYLDYNNGLQAWDDLDLAELAVGVESGMLPPPEVDLDWAGEPVAQQNP